MEWIAWVSDERYMYSAYRPSMEVDMYKQSLYFSTGVPWNRKVPLKRPGIPRILNWNFITPRQNPNSTCRIGK